MSLCMIHKSAKPLLVSAYTSKRRGTAKLALLAQLTLELLSLNLVRFCGAGIAWDTLRSTAMPEIAPVEVEEPDEYVQWELQNIV